MNLMATDDDDDYDDDYDDENDDDSDSDDLTFRNEVFVYLPLPIRLQKQLFATSLHRKHKIDASRQ
jgi:hypothetical protein